MESGTWHIDAARSTVRVSIRHLGVTTVRGTFEDVEGKLQLAEDGSAAVAASIGTASISTGDPKRDEFLASPEFFDAAAHPRATFVASGRALASAPSVLAGTLTIAGTSAPLELTVELEEDRDRPRLRVRVRADVDRHAFGLRFPQAAGAGDVAVGRKATLMAAISLGA